MNAYLTDCAGMMRASVVRNLRPNGKALTAFYTCGIVAINFDRFSRLRFSISTDFDFHQTIMCSHACRYSHTHTQTRPHELFIIIFIEFVINYNLRRAFKNKLFAPSPFINQFHIYVYQHRMTFVNFRKIRKRKIASISIQYEYAFPNAE